MARRRNRQRERRPRLADQYGWLYEEDGEPPGGWPAPPITSEPGGPASGVTWDERTMPPGVFDIERLDEEPPARAEPRRSSRPATRPASAPDPAPASSARPSDAEHRRSLIRSTAIFSFATGLSRILGLVREIVVRRYFGVEGEINAFTVAFQVPNLIRALVADAALSSAFVPVFSELLEKGDRRRAWQVASTIFWLMTLGLAALTAVFILAAPWIMRPFGYDGADEDLVIGLSRVLFPTVALLGVSGVVVGILNSYEHFTVPALTPIFWNLAIIVGLIVGIPHLDSNPDKLYLYAIVVLVGTVVQVLLPLPWLRGRDGSLRPIIHWRDPAVKRVFVLMVPVTLGLGLINVNLVIDTFFAARFLDPQLAPSAIDAAFRVYMLPQGIFSVAVATVLFPAMSRLAARADMAGFTSTVSSGLRQIGFMLVPASAVSAVLAVPMIRLLYERGAFDGSETDVVAACLAAFSAGLTFNGTMLLLNRAFFSLQHPWLPTLVALGNLGLNVAGDAILYRVGIWGIPLATSIVNIGGTAALVYLLRRRLGPIGGAAIVASYLRIALASAASAGAAFGVWLVVDGLVGRSTGGQVVSVGLGLAAAIVVYLVSARLLGIRELDALLTLLRRRRAA
ncbi:MAG: murein biosynthesis integral membrane protein MurJ [Thermoleophilia bacterium]